MAIGKQPFELPMNAVKKETSLQEKILIQSHDAQMNRVFFTKTVDRRVHTRSVKVKFFVVGYRLLSVNQINYVGKWVELEPHELDFTQPVTGGMTATYFLGFYPTTNAENTELNLNLHLFPYPNANVRGEIYIEKLTVMDSDFDSSLSWLTDDTIPPIVPPINPPIPPDPPDPPDPPIPPAIKASLLTNTWIYE